MFFIKLKIKKVNLKNQKKIENFRETVPSHVTSAVYNNYLLNENE